jgi:hypothetical protein
MTKNEALRLASVVLDHCYGHHAVNDDMIEQTAKVIQAALEAKDEPVAYINVEQRKLEWAKYMSWDTPTVVNLPKIPLYTTPPQRTWVGLTDEEKQEWIDAMPWPPQQRHIMVLIDGIESEIKENNL